MECIHQCVFGAKSSELPFIKYLKQGKSENVNPGLFLRMNFVAQLERLMMPYRLLFDIFDYSFVGSFERDVLANSDEFRDFLKSMIKKRREEMKDPSFISKGDFLTQLLSDELFMGQEDYIVDECLTFMVAATQTTTLMVSNSLYYLI